MKSKTFEERGDSQHQIENIGLKEARLDATEKVTKTTVFDTLNPNHKNYIPYGGFRKAPTKFTSKHSYKGREKKRKGDVTGWWCKCGTHNYGSYINIYKFTWPSYPYMAIRNRPFCEVKRECWKCGHVQTNITLDKAKTELE